MAELNNNDQNQNINQDNNMINNQGQYQNMDNTGMNSQTPYGYTDNAGMNHQYAGNGQNPGYTDNNNVNSQNPYGYTDNNNVNNQNPYGNMNNNGMNNQNQYGNTNYQNQYGNRYNNGVNNQNPYNDRGYNGTDNQNQYNKVPEYSFWAEQVPNNPYYNQGTNTWQNTDPNINQNEAGQGQKNGKKKHSGKFIKFIAKAACFGLIAGLGFFGLQKVVDVVDPGNATSTIISAAGDSNSNYKISYTQAASVKTKSKSAITSVVNSTLPSIVQINCKSTQTASDFFGQQYNQEVEGSGSGIIVSKTDKELLIATNNHVVEGATEITVTFADNTKAKAEVKGTDSTADLAVVSVDISSIKDSTLNKISVAKLGNSNNVKVGEMSIAIGNALGYGQSVTVGYISAKNRKVDVSDGDTSKSMSLLQTDAAINPGNSGGALLNVKGEVIGINSVKYSSTEVEGMGYAIPISKATPIIKELMSRQVLSSAEQGYLGVSGYDVTEEVSKYYNIPIGVYVKEVVSGGAADKAGLKAEDIITKVNDMDVTSITQLKDYVNSLKVGTKVQVTYARNTDGKYKKAKVTVTLGKNPQLSSSNH